jgi:hypothetical protein
MEAAAMYASDAPTFEPVPTPAPERFEAWGYVELMGHSRIAGRLSEQAIAGKNLLRVDIPQSDGSFRTEFFGGSAIFRITPAEEAVIRKIVERIKPEPVFSFLLESRPRLAHIGEDADDEFFNQNGEG